MFSHFVHVLYLYNVWITADRGDTEEKKKENCAKGRKDRGPVIGGIRSTARAVRVETATTHRHTPDAHAKLLWDDDDREKEKKKRKEEREGRKWRRSKWVR